MLKHFQLGIRLALASFPRPSQPNVLVLRSAMGLHESSVNLHERSAVEACHTMLIAMVCN